MQFEFQRQAESTGGSDQLSFTSDESRLFLTFRKKMMKEIEVMVIRTVERVTLPVVEDLMRKVVKEEFQSARDKIFTGGTRNDGSDITMSTRKSLRLKFIHEISSIVLTGKEIKGEGDSPLKVALVDETTGNVVQDGPEASAVVEILVLDASAGPFGTGDNGCDLSLGEFNNRIIRDNDKKKPHFTKSQYVSFKEGVGVLSDVKLAQDSGWTKNCHCRLGARIVGDFGGTTVKEASTNPFLVKDGRGSLYDKHYPPHLSDELWRLENIGKYGAPCQRLNDKKIMTVQDFLFLNTIDPQRLKKIAGAKLWKDTVRHAQTCEIDDKKIYLFYSPSSESRMGVVFDVVGGTKGMILDSHYVSDNNLSEAEKVRQHKLLLSAFENRKDMTSFADEASLLCQFPYPPIDKDDSILSTGPSVSDTLAISANTNVHDPEKAGTSSECIASHVEPHALTHLGFCDSLHVGQIYEPFFKGVWYDIEPLLETFGDNEGFMSLISPRGSSLSEAYRAETSSQQQSGVGRIKWVRAVDLMLWLVRARKKVISQGDNHVSKKQKTG